MRKSSPTSASRHSTFSTRKTLRSPRPASNWLGGDAAAAADAADALGAAAAAAAVAVVAAGQLDVAAPAKAESRSTTFIDISFRGRVLLDPAPFAFFLRPAFLAALAAGAVNNVDNGRRAS